MGKKKISKTSNIVGQQNIISITSNNSSALNEHSSSNNQKMSSNSPSSPQPDSNNQAAIISLFNIKNNFLKQENKQLQENLHEMGQKNFLLEKESTKRE